jgi:hypothetical protein
LLNEIEFESSLLKIKMLPEEDKQKTSLLSDQNKSGSQTVVTTNDF